MNPLVILTSIVGALGVMVGAYFAFWGRKRETSGSVQTTDAQTLWNQAEAIRKEAISGRQEALARADKLQGEVDELREQLHSLENARFSLDHQVAVLRQENSDSTRVIITLREEIAAMNRRMERVEKL